MNKEVEKVRFAIRGQFHMNCYLLTASYTVLYLVYDSTVPSSFIMAGSSSYLSSCPMITGAIMACGAFSVFRLLLPKASAEIDKIHDFSQWSRSWSLPARDAPLCSRASLFVIPASRRLGSHCISVGDGLICRLPLIL